MLKIKLTKSFRAAIKGTTGYNEEEASLSFTETVNVLEIVSQKYCHSLKVFSLNASHKG